MTGIRNRTPRIWPLIEFTEGADVCGHDGAGEPTVLPVEIQRSAAGFYVSGFCPKCVSYDRKSGYFGNDREAVAEALARWSSSVV